MGDWADILLIAPITYNTIGKLAAGIADNFLTCIAAAWPKDHKPLVLAPAMNTRMWEDPIIADNLEWIGNRFIRLTVVEPVEGPLACGGTGMGAMAHVRDIVACVSSLAE
jgi:phosphopantothenoylcysteine synthetase/decarboxylase